MNKSNVLEFQGRDTIADPLTWLLRTGKEQLIYPTMEAKLQELLADHSERRTENGKMCRNGYQSKRVSQTGTDPVIIRIPRVRSKTGDPVILYSARQTSADDNSTQMLVAPWSRHITETKRGTRLYFSMDGW